jgi:pilus assembly protein FimV
MARKFLSVCLLSVLFVPAVVQSLGLGEIRLNSYLNQPLDAEIELMLSSPDELRSLELRIPDRETFERLGLDRPGFLDQVEFEIDGAPGSRARINVRSTDAVVEPFLTFLVEATWSGGRLLREYTVLLDPPAFMPGGEAPASTPVQAPAATDEGTLTRPAPAPVAAPAPEPVPAPPTPAPAPAKPSPGFESAPGTYGPVQRSETLWGIAEGVRPDDAVSMNQMMMALYEANPEAFEGNINRLRAGTILRVPERSEIIRLGAGEATRAVMAQNEAWRGRIERPRLELVPPSDDAGDAPVAGSGEPGAAGDAPDSATVNRLSSELEETRRLLEVRDAEIARLQTRLEQLELEAAARPDQVPGAEGPVIETPLDEEPLVEVPLTEDLAEIAGVDPETGEPISEPETDLAEGQDGLAEPAGEAVEEETAPAPAVSEPPAVRPAPEPSLFERLTGLLGSLWLWLILGLGLLAGAALWFMRSRREDDDFATTWSAEEEAATARDTQTLAPPKREEPAAIVVEEQQLSEPAAAQTGMEADGDDVTPTAGESDDLLFAPEPDARDSSSDEGLLGSDADYEYPFEDTIAGDTAVALEQQDPLAEADFHMAYGLYDQAAELVKGAIQREPDRLDLRRKLLDICFVWGNREEFMAQAGEFKGLVGETSLGEWNKVAIMGRQICPDEALFEEAEAEMGGADLDLEFGDGADDSPADGGDSDVLDFDLGDTTGEAPVVDADEVDDEKPAVGLADSGVIDFDVGSTNEYRAPVQSLEPTRQTPALGDGDESGSEHTEELAIEDLGLDLDLGETGQHALDELAAEGTDFDLGDSAETRSEAAFEDVFEGAGVQLDEETKGHDEPAEDAVAAVEVDDELPVPEESTDFGDDDTAIGEAMPDTGSREETQVAEIVGDDDTAMAELLGEDVVTSTGIFNFDETSVIETGDRDGTAVFSESDEEATDAVERAEPEDETWVEQLGSLGEDDDTLHPGEMKGLDEDTVRERALNPDDSPDQEATANVETLGLSDSDSTHADSTAEYESVDDDLDLDDLTAALKADVEATAEYPAAGDDEAGGTGLLEELLGDDQATQIAPGLSGLMSGETIPGEGDETAQVQAVEPDPITLSEVGTKLDLARAYIDMGDPDGARSILEEVMDEGTDGQKDEARQLIESLS